MVPGYPHSLPPKDGSRMQELARSLLLVFACFPVWETQPFSSEIWTTWKGCARHSVSCHDAALASLIIFLKLLGWRRVLWKAVLWVWRGGCTCELPADVFTPRNLYKIKPIQKLQHGGGRIHRTRWGTTGSWRLLQKGDSLFFGSVATTGFPGPSGWPAPLYTSGWIYDLVEPG